MGIEKFFKSIENDKITNLNDKFTIHLETKIPTKYLFIDFNSIIYITSAKLINELNKQIYKNSPPPTNLEQLIIDSVQEYILNILQNYIDPKKLKYLFIAVDGVPDKAKIIEQKQRRYITGILTEIKKKIFQEHLSEIKKDTKRYEYELHKINWSRNNISPGTKFMDNVDIMLNSEILNSSIKKLCPNLKTYICNGVHTKGEGEKKITDNIKKLGNINSVTIYSPDTDVTLLGLILHIEKLTILRHNQQENIYNVINIDKLSNNLFSYIKSKTKNKNIKKKEIIDDIVFVLTLFGNDFLPKMQSYDVKNDFHTIIDKYIETFNTTSSSYIIQNKRINQQSFLAFIKLLHHEEGKRLQNIYASSNYKNYKKLLKTMNATSETFTDILTNFLTKLKTLNSNISSNSDLTPFSQDTDFLEKLKRLLQSNEPNTTFLKSYQSYFHQNKKFPPLKLSFIKYSKSLNENNNREKLEQHNNNFKVLKYDEEIFKFDNMLDEYTTKLNAFPINLGYINIDKDSFSFKTDNIDDSIKKYYKEFFHLSNINPENKDLQSILENYLEGFLWILEYYYLSELDNTTSIWFYKHHFSPLLKQIYQFLKDKEPNYINNLHDSLSKYRINADTYFTETEHLLYTSPVKLIKNLIPEKYYKIINNTDLFPDTSKVADDIYNNKTNTEIDCRGAFFINKCSLKIINNKIDYSFDKKFIKEIREV